jgi:lysophospholipase L1-like esterase
MKKRIINVAVTGKKTLSVCAPLFIFCVCFSAIFAVADWLVGPYLFLTHFKSADLSTGFNFPEEERLPPRVIQLMGFHSVPNATIFHVPINRLGFAGVAPDIQKLPGTIRVLTLGGSTFFNRNIADSLSVKLNALLSQSDNMHKAEVLGGALQTHTSRSSVLKLQALRRYGFDAANGFDYVVIYHGINDLWANNYSPEEFRNDYAQIGPWYRHNFFLDHSLIARKIYNDWIYPRLYVQRAGGYPQSAEENKTNFASEETFRNNIQQLIDDTRSSGSAPILMTFAWHIPQGYTYELFAEHALGYDGEDSSNETPVEMWGSVAYVQEGLARHNAVVRQLAAKNNVPLLDMETLIGHDASKFGDVCHLSVSGTQLMVNALAGFLQQQHSHDAALKRSQVAVE